MTIVLYDVCVPSFQQVLGCQLGMLHKASAYVASRKIPVSALLEKKNGQGERSFAMVAITPANLASEACAVAANVPNPIKPVGNKQISIGDIIDYTGRAQKFILSIPRDRFSQDGKRIVKVPVPGHDAVQVSIKEFILHMVLPNIFLHCSMTYCILNNMGVGVGKKDYPYPPI